MVGRFAPSPSGRMHLGNVFSALMAWLSVRAQGGTMLLRIEDLDPDRCKAAYARQLKDDLLWLGLDWDVETQWQSQRSAVYAEAFEKLNQLGLVYPCYCTRNELHDASAPHASDGTVLYSGRCRNLTAQQRAIQTRKPAWRICVPEETVSFTDGLQGSCCQNLASECGDFIIRRSDGVYAYQLAVVVDDAQMGVTEVVRGNDLCASTPRQLYLYRLLGYTPPQFYHIPLLTAADGRRLSKRDGDLDMGALRQAYRPQELIGLLAKAAGLLPEYRPIAAHELAAQFDWRRVKAVPAIPVCDLLRPKNCR